MRAAGELQPPVGYDDRWLELAVAAVVAVAAYYLLSWWLTRPPRGRSRTRRPPARQLCLTALDRIEAAVAARELAPREAHQQVSRAVREFVAAESGLPAGTMTLATLRRDGPAPLADLVAVLYPPEFGPSQERAAQDLAHSLRQARELVSAWP